MRLTAEQYARRTQAFKELNEAKAKMAIACQGHSKKAWRRYGKQVYLLTKEVGWPVDQWMEDAFGRSV